MLTAFVMIHTDPAAIDRVAQQIANLPNVAEVYSVTGDYDIVAVLRLAEYDLLAETVTAGLSQIPGVQRTQTTLAFRRFSTQDLEAAWDIGVS